MEGGRKGGGDAQIRWEAEMGKGGGGKGGFTYAPELDFLNNLWGLGTE